MKMFGSRSLHYALNVKANAPADWATTDEGKVCAGNTRANFFGKPALKSDGVRF